MARRKRCSDAGDVYHVLNRAVGRATLFNKSPDHAAFEKVLRQAWERTAMRLLHYGIMPNHWHLLVWPRQDGERSTWWAGPSNGVGRACGIESSPAICPG